MSNPEVAASVMQAAEHALAAIFDEMRRQPEDARRSFADNGEVAERIAAAARGSGRLLLLGMGGSHAVNRIAEPLYRAAGIDTNAVVGSEALNAPFPPRGATILLNSQSGESGETVAYLARGSSDETRFGLTLNAESALARAAPVDDRPRRRWNRPSPRHEASSSALALHARVLHALGVPHDRAVEAATDAKRSHLSRP